MSAASTQSRPAAFRSLRTLVDRGANARARLVCLPWCGAGASVYRRFLPYLPNDISLYATQLPGREECFTQPRLRRMNQVVDFLLPDIARLCGDRQVPLVVFGHSMGAVVAFEVLRVLARLSCVHPALLVVSGHASPSASRGGGTSWHSADDAELIRNIRALGGTPEAVLQDDAMMRTLLPLMKADYEVLETYAPHVDGAVLNCPLIACAGTQDSEVTPHALESWRGFTASNGRTHWFDGCHFYLQETPAPLVAKLVSWIRELPKSHPLAALQL